MQGMAINLARVSRNLVRFRDDYCRTLKNDDQVTPCGQVKPGIEITSTRLYNNYKHVSGSMSECVDYCLEDLRCIAITYCLTCKKNSYADNTCYMFQRRGKSVRAGSANGWVSYVFYEKISAPFVLPNTLIRGVPRELEKNADRKASKTRCNQLCLKDPHCVTYTYVTSRTMADNCRLYGAEYIQSMVSKSGASTTFAPWRKRQEAIQATIQEAEKQSAE